MAVDLPKELLSLVKITASAAMETSAMKSQRLMISVCSLWLACLPTIAGAPTVRSAPPQYSAEERTNINVYRTVSPAVVTIRVGTSSGSGTIVRENGLILTSEHVVQSAQGEPVLVLTASGKRYQGQVTAIDRRNDLALIQLSTRDRLPTVRLAPADKLQVGQRVYAIGSPFGLSGTLTTGILNRISQTGDLQTNVELNPGNSGGPLLNAQGEIIGVNKAVILPNFQGNKGFSLATNILVARSFIQQHQFRTPTASAVAQGRSETSTRSSISTHPTTVKTLNPTISRLGVVIDPNTLVIQSVQQGSPAAALGLRAGDRLIGINGQRIRSTTDLTAVLSRRPTKAFLTVLRDRRLAIFRISFL